MFMNRTLAFVLLIAGGAGPIWPCDCRAPRPACAYVGADAIFLGRVGFTNDDGSGTFLQATLVRFEIEEVFKGLPQGTKEVWVDPGSFTSCYENYHLGQRYLIVAQRKGQMPGDSAAMTVARVNGKRKPVPPGMNPARPPIIYWAPECSGSRPADGFPHIDVDYAMLRAYRSGQRLPRVFGWAYLAPFRGWPGLGGPPLKGAQITLTNDKATLTTTTLADGTFTLAEAPAGVYSLKAEMPPLVSVLPQTILTVPEVGCGSQDIALRTTSELRGSVLDPNGRPVPRIPVDLEVISTSGDQYPVTIGAEADAGGRFAIVGVPDTDVRLSYGSDHPSSERVPYPLVYYPDATGKSKAATLRLRVRERRTDIVLRLPAAPKVGRVKVKVTMQDGSPAKGAFINARLNGVFTEFVKASADGTADLPCLEGLRYELEAHVLAGREPSAGLIKNRPVPVVCGRDVGPFVLALDHVDRRL